MKHSIVLSDREGMLSVCVWIDGGAVVTDVEEKLFDDKDSVDAFFSSLDDYVLL